jgi:hypothetical protein
VCQNSATAAQRIAEAWHNSANKKTYPTDKHVWSDGFPAENGGLIMVWIRVLCFMFVLIVALLTACVPESMVQEAIAGTEAAWTPIPSQTPLPTNTPLATHTPYATFTPYPTLTPQPTYTPWPTFTATPEATATPERELLFEETFSAETTCFETGAMAAGDVSLKDESLQLNVTRLMEPVWTFCEEEYFSDFVLEVEAARVDGTNNNGYGLLFRGEQDIAYAFLVSSDQYYCLTYINLANLEEDYGLLGCWLPLAEINGGSHANNLRVVAIDNRLELYVNDILVGSLLEGTQLSGKIGFVASAYEGNGTQITFDNVRVTEP